jgi:hypothetical protein
MPTTILSGRNNGCRQFIGFDWTAAIMGQTTKKSLQLGNETNLAELLSEPVTSGRILDRRRRWWRGFDGHISRKRGRWRRYRLPASSWPSRRKTCRIYHAACRGAVAASAQ